MSSKPVLVVDDEPDIRELIEITLGRMKIESRSAGTVADAKALLAAHSFGLCLTDMNLPDDSGIELVKHINQHFPSLPVAVITAFGSMDAAIAALKAGAFDFVQKPVYLDQLRNLVDAAMQLSSMAPASDDSADGTTRLLGESAAMVRLRGQIRKLARNQAPVYVSGESGSGKELVARLMHEQGPRASRPFVPVNCGAIPSELMESEFFGHVKGSFTGAIANKEGLFQAANGGTLFLDEVADLPLTMQVKLLRAIQEKAVRAVGAQKEAPIDVRILSATHKDLGSEVDQGRFRQDLFYRINVIELRVPPLRDRDGDIPILANEILRRLASEYGGEAPRITKDAMDALIDYHFPGNVRELENTLERAYALCEDDVIRPHDLQLAGADDDSGLDLDEHQDDSDPSPQPPHTPQDGRAPRSTLRPAAGESLENYLEDIEKDIIMEALEATRWNKTAAAKRLGITFRALRYRLKKLKLE